MEKVKSIWNRIIFVVKNRKFRVKHVVYLLLILLLLLLLCKCTFSEDAKKEKKIHKAMEAAVAEVCEFPKLNLNDLETILSRSDLCSEPWYNAVDTYIERLEDQADILKDKEDSKSKDLYKVQTKLIDKLKDFRETQDEDTIEALEKEVEQYLKQSGKDC